MFLIFVMGDMFNLINKMEVIRTKVSLLKSVYTKFRPKIRTIGNTAFSPKYLLFTNLTISISLSGTGDVMEQHYEILNEELDRWSPTRTKHMAVSGASVGIICHFWYKYLDRKLPGRSIGVVIRKVIIDQLVCSPLCISSFFLTLAILENATLDEFIEEVKQKAWKLYAAEWVVWPTAQIINFYYLPTRYRVLYDNLVSLAYDVYTSKVKHGTS